MPTTSPPDTAREIQPENLRASASPPVRMAPSAASSAAASPPLPVRRRRRRPAPPPRASPPREVLSPAQRRKVDPAPDAAFYAVPRINVQHVDWTFRARAAALVHGRLAAAGATAHGAGDGPALLDLCSSWTSHLAPEDAERLGRWRAGGKTWGWGGGRGVPWGSSGAPRRSRPSPAPRSVGHGLSGPELDANPLFRPRDDDAPASPSGRFVLDLNGPGETGDHSSGPWRLDGPLDGSPGAGPVLLPASFDVVTCHASIQYLAHAPRALRSAARLLRPGGALVLTWSDRCFPTKALSAWTGNSAYGRMGLVAEYVAAAGGPGVWSSSEVVRWDERGRDAGAAAFPWETEGGADGGPYGWVPGQPGKPLSLARAVLADPLGALAALLSPRADPFFAAVAIRGDATLE